MGDVLSQNEIDELLKTLNAGELDVNQTQTTTQEKKDRQHDFRKGGILWEIYYHKMK